jgi:hypothetical protein
VTRAESVLAALQCEFIDDKLVGKKHQSLGKVLLCHFVTLCQFVYCTQGLLMQAVKQYKDAVINYSHFT